MTYDDDFLSTTADALSDMRVLVEGAITIFEDDTTPIVRLCTQHKEYEARTAFNDIGGALYNLRRQIKRLQEALHIASQEYPKEAPMLDKIQKRLLDLKAEQDADTPMHCPCCGANTMKQPLSTNALSRIADVYICDSCGTAEGLLAMMRHSYPLHRWHVFQPQKPESISKHARTRMCWQRYCRPRLIPWNTPSTSAGTIPTTRHGIATTHLKAVPV